MLNLLFDMNVVYDLLIVIFIMFFIIFAMKNPKVGGPVLGTIITVALVGLTIFCGVNLNSYYGAEGGLFGHLTGKTDTNVVQVEDFKYTFNNLELLQGDDDTYSASVILNKIVELDKNENYGIFVNNVPCDLVDYGENYLMADFRYVFYDKELQESCIDTLSYRLAFYKNYTQITIFTRGNDTAVGNWNKFLNANNMVLTIKPVDYSSNEDIEFGTGDISNFTEVVYLVDGVEYYSTYQKIGEKYKLPDAPEKTNNEFIGWKLNGQLIDSSSKVQGADVLIASFNYREQTNFKILSGDKSYDYTVFSDESFTFPSELDGLKIEGYVLEENYKNLSESLAFDFYPTEKSIISNELVLRAVAWREVELLESELTAEVGTNYYILGSLSYNHDPIFNACNNANFHPQLKYNLHLEASVQDRGILGPIVKTKTFNMQGSYRIDRDHVFTCVYDKDIARYELSAYQCKLTMRCINSAFSIQSTGDSNNKFTKISINDMYVLY